jgi:hypothetical protein
MPETKKPSLEHKVLSLVKHMLGGGELNFQQHTYGMSEKGELLVKLRKSTEDVWVLMDSNFLTLMHVIAKEMTESEWVDLVLDLTLSSYKKQRD